MKKAYVRPQSKLFGLKMKENIADSFGQDEDETSGVFVITFTQTVEPCRTLYSGIPNAYNTLGNNAAFMEYFSELQSLGAWACFTTK